MTGKDMRSRPSWGRRNGKKASPVAEAAMPGRLHSDDMHWADDQAKAEAESSYFLSGLPTPSRAAVSEMREEFHQSPNQLFQQLDQSGNRTDAWRMQHDMSPDDNLMAPAAQPQPSYRELLQARGQQAMQRSMGGRPCDSPVLSPTQWLLLQLLHLVGRF